MEKKKTPTFKLNVDQKDHGVYAISIVDKPAIDSNYMLFKKELDNKFTKIEFNSNEFSKDINLSADKQILTGAAMIPNYKIFRKDNNDNDYFVEISPEQIEQVALKFAKNNNMNNANMNHDKNAIIDSLTYYESWIVNDNTNDKSNVLGFKNIPNGTWMVSAKIEDPTEWAKIKEGNFNGFSIEGLFDLQPTEIEVQKSKISNKLEIYTIRKNKNTMLNKIIKRATNAIKAEFKTELKFQDLTLQDGTAVSIDETTGLVTYADGSAVPDGTYVLDDSIGELFVYEGLSVDQDDFDEAMLSQGTSEEPVTVEVDETQTQSKINVKPFTVKKKVETNIEPTNAIENSKLEFEKNELGYKTKIEKFEKNELGYKAKIEELEKLVLELGKSPATTHTTNESFHRGAPNSHLSQEQKQVQERIDNILSHIKTRNKK